MTKISVTRETLDALRKAKERSTSVRHLQSFTDTMARYHGDIERLVYAAEILCQISYADRNEIGRCQYPFVPDGEPHRCPLNKIRDEIGDHVKQDDATGVRG
jgi:hypothetical protein